MSDTEHRRGGQEGRRKRSTKRSAGGSGKGGKRLTPYRRRETRFEVYSTGNVESASVDLGAVTEDAHQPAAEFACDCCGDALPIGRVGGSCLACAEAGCRLELHHQWWTRGQQCPLSVRARSESVATTTLAARRITFLESEVETVDSSRKRQCDAPGCPAIISVDRLMCKEHWAEVSPELRKLFHHLRDEHLALEPWIGGDDKENDAPHTRRVVAVEAASREVAESSVDESVGGTSMLDVRTRSYQKRILSLTGDSTKRHDIHVTRREAALRGCALGEITIVRDAPTARHGRARAPDAAAHVVGGPSSPTRPEGVSFVLIRFLARLNDLLPRERLQRLKGYFAVLPETSGAERARRMALAGIDHYFRVALPAILREQERDEEAERLAASPRVSGSATLRGVLTIAPLPAFTGARFAEAEAVHDDPAFDPTEMYALVATVALDVMGEHPSLFGAADLLGCFDAVILALKTVPQLEVAEPAVVVAPPAKPVDFSGVVKKELAAIRSGDDDKSNVFSAPLRAAFAAMAGGRGV